MFIKPKKSLGQNFLIDRLVLEQIVNTVEIENKEVLEIGPGSGNLTTFILKKYPKKIYAVEKDSDLTLLLEDKDSIDNAPYVSLLDDKAKIVSSRLGEDRFRVAGTAEFNGYNKDIRADRINPLIKWCNELFPKVSTEHAIPWAGLRPMTPSMVPRVGSGKLPGIYYNTGPGHLGWTLSAFTSQQISDHIIRQDNKID